MKKTIMILTLALGIGISAYSQHFTSTNHNGGGMLGRGMVNNESNYGTHTEQYSLFSNEDVPRLPGHNLGSNQSAPVGSGALLLVGFGAAYILVQKRRKE